MKRAVMLVIALAGTVGFSGPVPLVEDCYDLVMKLRVPVVYDNTKSLGERKYKSQKLVGTVKVTYFDSALPPDVKVTDLVNRSYRVNGEHVTYDTAVDSVIWVSVGNNATERFKTAAVSFVLDADPSYNVGDDEPDNTLILRLSGYGTYAKYVRGYVAGQLGCGCRAYGHKSPTRIMCIPYIGSKYLEPACITGWPVYWYPTVTDIAPCWGTWYMRIRDRKTGAVDANWLL